jgi:hypothetical protein
MSNVFDDIYKKNLNLNFRNLNNGIFVEEKQTELNPKDLDDDLLNIMFSNLYNRMGVDDIPKYSQKEVEIIDEKIIRNRKRAETLRKEISKSKSMLIENIKDKGYTLDISKSNIMKTAANNIFGGNKRKISYDDYVVLLEMKRQIIINEADDILSEG